MATEELARMLREMRDTQKEIQRQLIQLQWDVSAEVVQKLEEKTIFKKKGNEIFRFDNRFENALEELSKIPAPEEPAVEGTPEVSAAVTAARVELTEGRLDIARRQKRIRIADRSEFGWTTRV